ncbi:hypothetical protein ACWDTI_26315 [Gordonia sp. NPDC003424]
MLASVVFVPSAPLLVPELSGPMAHDAEPVRAATLALVRDLAEVSTWVAVGAADESGQVVGPGATGTFARYGVDVGVSLDGETLRGSAGASHLGQRRHDGSLPLSMLIAAWLREQGGADVVRPVLVDPDATPAECARIGTDLAAEIDADAEPVGVLVVGDGAISLSARAPGGGLRPEAVELQARLDEAVGAGDCGAMAGIDPVACAAEGVGGRPAWQVAAALCADREIKAEMHYAGAPFGVGYVVAAWTPQ